MFRPCSRYNYSMPQTESDSLRELTEFALAWSLKHNKLFVGLEVDPEYIADPVGSGCGNPKIIATTSADVLPLVLRRAQFSACADMVQDRQALFEVLALTSQAGDVQSMDSLLRAEASLAQREIERETGVEFKPVAGTHLSVIEGGLATEPKQEDPGPFKPPNAS